MTTLAMARPATPGATVRWQITFDLDDPIAVASSEPVGALISQLYDAVIAAGGQGWTERRLQVLSDPEATVDDDQRD